MLKNTVLVLGLAALTCTQAGQATIETAIPNDIRDTRSGAYAFTNATIQTNPDRRVERGTLLIKEGKVVSVRTGANVPAGYAVVDLSGRYIYPSLIDLDSSYGLPEKEKPAPFSFSTPEILDSQVDGAYSPNDAIRAHYRSAEHFTANDKQAGPLRKAGFGAVLSHRQDGIARGTGALVLLGDQSDNELVLNADAAAHYSLSKGSSKQSYPISLMGSMALLRQTHLDAQWFARQQPRPFSDQSLEGWLATQHLPQIFTAGKDWRSLLRADKVGDEFNLQYIIRSSGDSYQRIDEVKATAASLIVPLAFPEAPSVADTYAAELVSLAELKHWELAPSNPSRLAEAGIEFAFTGAGEKTFWPNLRKAIKHGLDEQQALAALTTVPAKLVNEPRLGALTAGKLANFLVTSGPLFDKDTVIEENWIAGQRFQLAEHAKNRNGNYRLIVGGTDYPLEVSGKPGSPKAALEPNGGSTNVSDESADAAADSIKAKLTIAGDRVQMSFAPNKDAAPIRLNGWITDNSWQGRGQLGDGRWVDWSANRVGDIDSKEDPKDSDEEDDALDLGPVTFPFAAYGRRQQPTVEPLLFQGATVWTNESDGIIEDADVLVRNGKIARVGKGLSAAGASVIDARGMHLTSGIIDEHSHIALDGVNDIAVNSGMVRMGDVINSEDVNIYRNLAGGVTAAQLLHGSANPIGGQSALVKYRWGANPEQMKIEGAVGFIKFALGENVKRSANSQSIRYPQTRMGVEQVYRDAFTRAGEYQSADSNKRRDLALEAIVEILQQERFITCHSYVQSEINMLMKVAEDFDFNVNTFTHILEGYKVADKMAAHGVGGSTFADWWAYKWEVRYAIPYNPALMTQAGVTVAINSDSSEMSRRLNHEAAKSIKYGGMSEEDAWKMVTLNPAKLLHLDDRMGSVRAGKDADLVLWTDNPLSVYAKAEMTLVDGAIQFSRATDAAARNEIREERARLIAKALKAGGDKPGKSKAPKAQRQWHCDSLHGYEHLLSGSGQGAHQ